MVIYFQTPKLADGAHEIDITVTTANETDQFIIDFFLVSPIAGGSGSATPVGAIAGGVVGGVFGIGILGIALWYFMGTRTGCNLAHYFKEPNLSDIPVSEGLCTFHRLCRREIRGFTQTLLDLDEKYNPAAITPTQMTGGQAEYIDRPDPAGILDSEGLYTFHRPVAENPNSSRS